MSDAQAIAQLKDAAMELTRLGYAQWLLFAYIRDARKEAKQMMSEE